MPRNAIFLFSLSGSRRCSQLQRLSYTANAAVLNMIRFLHRDPTGLCNLGPDWTGFRKNLYRIGYGYPNCVDHCS